MPVLKPIASTGRSPAGALLRDPVVRLAVVMAVLGGAFPLAHAVRRVMGTTSPEVEALQNGVAIAAMVLLGALAATAYRAIESRRAASARVRAAFDQRLREAEKMEAVGRFSTAITHELLNLLNAVGGYIDLTLDDLGTDQRHADNLRRAHDVVRRSTVFAKRLLVLSRGKPFLPTATPLHQTVRDLMLELRPLVNPPAAVREQLGHDDGCIAISASCLRDVLVPLATNAGEAMEHGGWLTLETGWVDLDAQAAMAKAVRPGRFGRLVVGDTGPGMSNEAMRHLFEPFFTTKAKPRTRGLGLAAAYVLVTQHSGSITVSTQAGVGTSVELLIPAAP
ncbi:MAG: ATP-binding protein [Acidobacteriota bacterium]